LKIKSVPQLSFAARLRPVNFEWQSVIFQLPSVSTFHAELPAELNHLFVTYLVFYSNQSSNYQEKITRLS